MMNPQEGNITKSLKIAQAQDGRAWFFNITQAGKAAQPVDVSVMLTPAELTVSKCAFRPCAHASPKVNAILKKAIIQRTGACAVL